MQQGLKGSIAGVVAAATLLAGGILTVPHAMALEADGQYYSSKQPYVAPSEATTASYSQAPEGYETVYTESMARHGSRGLSSYKYDALLMKMAEAAEADNGFKSDAIKSEFMKNLKAITAANVENGYGMLTGQGADQHQGIGARAYERNKTLNEKQLIAATDYEQSVYNYEKAKSNYESSQASLAKAERNLSYATITSPIDGVVISRDVEAGQTVASGFETPTLFTIAADLTQMQVVADVDEADIGQVADGQRVQFSVDAYPDDTFEGTVLQVRLEATTESNVVTYEVVIDAPNPDLKLKPGLTANVTIFTLEKDDATAVPTKALRFVPNAELLGEIGLTAVETDSQAAPGSRELWVKEGTTLRPRRVYAGAASGDMTEITEGLTGSEEIVTGLVTAKPREETAAIERSPFMPGPPGSNDKKK